MGKYSSDNAETIKNQFSLEGEALERAGFDEPDLSPVPEEVTELTPVRSDLPVALGVGCKDLIELHGAYRRA